MTRLLIVSNRLPVTLHSEDGEPRVSPSIGGLATGLRGPHERSGGVWIGWPGHPEPADALVLSEYRELLAAHGTAPVWLTAAEVSRFYEQVCNGVVWPLFHYLLDHVPLRVEHWDTYEAVNARFAEVVAAQYRPGDAIWVHDFQLMRLPALLRERLPGARIGYFLHIPFPSAEVFAALPARESVLRGLLGADVVGFHTDAYARYFLDAVTRHLGLPSHERSIRVGGREVRVGVFPMGVDAAAYEARAHCAAVDAEIEALAPRGGAPDDVALFVGVDRLDYTKGIYARLRAYGELVQDGDVDADDTVFVQVATPSRERVQQYRQLRDDIDRLVGRINGDLGRIGRPAIAYLHTSYPREEMAALYQAADIMVVTPLRDGMNLVAKEYVACRLNGDGALVLSEFAGAADELRQAYLINPYDINGMKAAILQALNASPRDLSRRMRAMRRTVADHDVADWASDFLSALAESRHIHRKSVRPVEVSP
jgi:trehalose 6-phosphate synthase